MKPPLGGDPDARLARMPHMTAWKSALRPTSVSHILRRAAGLSVVVTAASACGAQAASADDIFGTWMRDDNAARVLIAECGTSICATNTWIRDPVQQHEKVGDKLVFKIARTGDGWSGEAFDPQRNLEFSATLHAEGADMTTRGCMFGGMVCKTTSWKRE
jgi:uncharacterized protein (DUF2147 family)